MFSGLPDPDPLVRGMDPESEGTDPDPYQNVTDPQHWLLNVNFNEDSDPPSDFDMDSASKK